MTLLEAISVRHSVRQYLDRPLAEDTISAIQRAIDSINLEGGTHFQMIIDDKSAFNSGLAKYGNFQNVSNYFAIIAPKGNKGDILAGYYGERLVLYIQTLGLNSCWVGLTFKNNKKMYQLSENEELKCVIAFGYGATPGSWHPLKRKVSDVSINKTKEQILPAWFVSGIKAALLSPTAINQHKYVFILHENNVVEALPKFSIVGYTYIDLCIVKYHFELGAGIENFSWL